MKIKKDFSDETLWGGADASGEHAYELIRRLYDIPRSITGEGFRKSLDIVNAELCGGITYHEVPSGTRVFDWVVPDEWNCRDAYIIASNGEKICDFKQNNLHVLNYSEPIDAELDYGELHSHLYSLPDLPTAVPYVTSYYERRWGFCLSDVMHKKLGSGKYRVHIDSSFDPRGSLVYGTLDIPATSRADSAKTILITTYLCHPRLANDNLSGPAVWVELAKWLRNLPIRRYNYKFLINPETIGSIAFIHDNFDWLKANVVGGFVLSCMGDEENYSVTLSPDEDAPAARAALSALKKFSAAPQIRSFVYRASDERQFDTPKLNLNMVCISRSAPNTFNFYHTSLDDLDFVTPAGLAGGLRYARECVLNTELNKTYELTTVCEPNLGSRGLIGTLGYADYVMDTILLRHFLAYCDGRRDLLAIADILDAEPAELARVAERCESYGLVKEIKFEK